MWAIWDWVSVPTSARSDNNTWPGMHIAAVARRSLAGYDALRAWLRRREGAFLTRRDRLYALNHTADMLHALGFRRLRTMGLKRKHVDALVAEWQRRGLTAGTMNPSCPVRKLRFPRYVERYSRRSVTTFVRARR